MDRVFLVVAAAVAFVATVGVQVPGAVLAAITVFTAGTFAVATAAATVGQAPWTGLLDRWRTRSPDSEGMPPDHDATAVKFLVDTLGEVDWYQLGVTRTDIPGPGSVTWYIRNTIERVSDELGKADALRMVGFRPDMTPPPSELPTDVAHDWTALELLKGRLGFLLDQYEPDLERLP